MITPVQILFYFLSDILYMVHSALQCTGYIALHSDLPHIFGDLNHSEKNSETKPTLVFT